MATMTAAQAIAKFLKTVGTDRYYLYNGHANWGLLDALEYSVRIKGVRMRHEAHAIHAADIDWRMRREGPIPVTCTTAGPGNFNAIPGIAEAYYDSIPMLCLMGGGPTRWFGRGGIQEVYRKGEEEFIQLFKNITKYAVMAIRPDTILDTLMRCYKAAVTGRPGPAVLYVPLDIQNTVIDVEIPEDVGRWLDIARPAPDPGAVQKAVDLIEQAERPVLYCSSGIHTSCAWAELQEFAEKAQIPVATTFAGKGAISEEHVLSLGVSNRSGTGQAVNATSTADLVIGIGVRFNDLNTAGWTLYDFDREQDLIHIDIDPDEISRVYPPRVAMVSDARLGLRAMIGAWEARGSRMQDRAPWLKTIEDWRAAWHQDMQERISQTAAPMHYERIVHDISEAVNEYDPQTALVVDTGIIMNYVPAFYKLAHPYWGTNNQQFGQMGFGPPGVISGGFARPDHPVVVFCGDQSFIHGGMSLATAFEYGIPGVVVVLQNYTIQAEVEGARKKYGRGVGDFYRIEDSGELWNPDLTKIGEALGARVIRVTRPEQLKTSMTQALESGALCILLVESANDTTRYAVEAVVKEGMTPLPYDWAELSPVSIGRVLSED